MDAMQEIGRRVREDRLALGLKQVELAERADVSRALIGALEHGRHMPAADAAIRVARALNTSVERLFDNSGLAPAVAAIGVLGERLLDGALVRAAWVETAMVVRVLDAVAALSPIGALADGVVFGGQVRLFSGAAPRGAVIAGCDPVLGIAEGLLERSGDARIVGVPTTSGRALDALKAGRSHGALVHGPAKGLKPPPGVQRWHLARWRSGVATHPRLSRPSLEALLADEVPMIQRDPSAASQQAFQRAAKKLGAPRPSLGTTSGSHFDAARSALEHRAAAVTIEPIAVAVGLDFHELEVHDVELWVPKRWTRLPGIREFVELLGTSRFQDRAGALPAYDLTSTGAAR
ncbi:MAG: helix-turn-helix domain-containing protein [Solirubrobacterales bacterium]|nr:helix-turn-helix domain-containing protein [Solirubrobacterales bacterium]